MASVEDRVAALETENASLKATIEALTKRLDALESGEAKTPKSTKTRTTTASRASKDSTTTKTRPSTAAPAGSKRRSSSANIAKPLQARVKEEKDEALDSLPDNRKGNYSIGNRTIHYVLPAEYAKDEKGEFPKTELKDELALEYVYGYNGKATYSNLFFAKEEGKLVYSVAGTGVVSDVASRTQKFFIGHNEDILSLAVHPSQPIVATGQLDPKGKGTPYICIWNESTCELVRKITFHERGIVALAFSPDGKYLLSIGNDDSHTLAIWQWEDEGKGKKGKAEPLMEQMTSKSPVYGIYFAPLADAEESKGRYDFVTVGEKLLKVWTAANLDKDKKARSLSSRIPSTFSKTKVVVKHFMGVAFTKDGHTLVGTDSGQLYKIKDTDLVKYWDAHQGAVTACCSTGDNFVSAGEDGKLKVWDLEGKEVSVIDLSSRGKGECVASSLDFKDGKLIVGLTSNAILQVELSSSAVVELVNGHSDEVWALAVHPTQPFAITGAHDKTIRVVNYETKETLKEKTLNIKGNVRSATFSEDGKYVAVGTWTGKVALIDFEGWSVVWNNKFAKETVDAIAFSPDGASIAAGSWDQITHIINVADGKERATCKGHTSSIMMLNYSVDNKYIMTNSRDYEILYWNAETGKRVNRSEVIDTKWTSWNCFLGWPVQGIWEGAGDGTDINAVDRSKDEHVLACGDDFGQVRLYAYPALNKNSPHKDYPGHSSFVTAVRWTPSGNYLFSAGGNDCGVFQWKHISA